MAGRMYLPRRMMPLFRPLFLAGIALFLAAQQALCACAAPQAMAPAAAMEMAHEMPAGHACDEGGAPEHDEANCPHCGTDTRLILKAAQAVPAPALPVSPAPALFQLAEVAAPPLEVRPPKRALYEAAGPPRQTPRQLKTRFLN